MSSFFWTTYVVLWVAVVVLVLLVLLLYRQFGLAYMQGQRRLSLQGLDIGAESPPLNLRDPTSSEVLELGWDGQLSRRGRIARLLLFALPTCPICEELPEQVGAVASAWRQVEFVWVHGTSGAAADALRVPLPERWIVGVSPDEAAHSLFEVPAVPYGYVMDKDGRVLSKRLVNNREDVERILVEALGPAESSPSGSGAAPLLGPEAADRG